MKNCKRATGSEYSKKNGDMIHVEIHARKAKVDGKAITFGTIFDVTEEVKANLTLKENQERFKSLFDNNRMRFLRLIGEGISQMQTQDVRN